MRIVYYTKPAFLEHVFSQVRALAAISELHLILEIASEGWQSNVLDLADQYLPGGLHDGREFFRSAFSGLAGRFIDPCASITLNVYSQQMSFHPRTVRQSAEAVRFMETKMPDVVYLDDISLRLALGIHEMSAIPIVVNIHDPVPHTGEENWKGSLARKLIFRRTSHFILHSEYTRRAFIDRFRTDPQNTSTVRLGVMEIYHEYAPVAPAELRNVILLLGRLSKYKGVELFVRAAGTIAEQIPDCEFVIAGRSSHGYRMPNLPALSNGGRFTIVNRYLNNREVAGFLRDARIISCPYEEATQSGVVLAAYAFGKPVIVTAVGGLPEYVWEGITGRIVPPASIPDLSMGTVDIFSEDPSKWENRIDEIRLGELSWDKSAVETIQIFEKVLA